VPRTPDRAPGVSDEEETIYEVNTSPIGGPGSVSFDGTVFKMQDAAGFYDPRIGSSALDVKDESVAVPNTPHVSLNFTGAGVTVSDAGGGIADVTIPGGGGANDLQHGTFDVVFPEGHDEVLGTVTGLSVAPLKIMPSEPIEVGTSVWSGVRWALAITNLNSDGFDWALRILDEANWAGPGSTTVRVPYIWAG